MVYLTIGAIMFVLCGLLLLLPRRFRKKYYSYRSLRATRTPAHWELAQKTLGKWGLLIGGAMMVIGGVLRYFQWTNFFLIEIFLLVLPIALLFYETERTLANFDQQMEEKEARDFSAKFGDPVHKHKNSSMEEKK
ncbi:MAG: hypothetical protein LKJ03_04930 [Enterococcaceae bacterium]|nr:hypothetical protein [Enterococcaceae bacterium]MCI1919529.1 hypothetical protein [Enterococcaceae bacterium]